MGFLIGFGTGLQKNKMNIVKGDLWKFWEQGNWIGIPINGSLDKNGCLVMGAGLAKEAKMRVPGVEKKVGELRKNIGLRVYCLPEYRMIFIPTKRVWFDKKSSIYLIKISVSQLNRISDKIVKNAYIPYLGCGIGGLSWSVVQPILEGLDDRFIIVEKSV